MLVAAVVLATGSAAGVLLRAVERASAAAGDTMVGSADSITSAGQPGPATVEVLREVAAHPDGGRVRAVLQDHFNAINQGDYDLWTTTVTARRAANTARSVWQQQYRSTLDGSIVVHRLEDRPGGGHVALISFTSVQDPADAPPDMPVECLRWRVSYPLVQEAGQWRLAPAAPNASLRAPC